MNTSNITNYKPKDFAELLGVSVKLFNVGTEMEFSKQIVLQLIEDIISILHVFSCRLYGLRKYKNQIKEDEEIAKELQNGNKPNAGTNTKDK